MAGKSEGALREGMKAWAQRAWVVWVLIYLVATMATFFAAPGRLQNAIKNPLAYLGMCGILGGLIYFPIAIKAEQFGRAFVSSSAAIISMIILVGQSLYPNLVPAINDPALSLSIANASSTPHTLITMLIIAAIGVPIVLAYTIFIYRVFRGKVVLSEDSY